MDGKKKKNKKKKGNNQNKVIDDVPTNGEEVLVREQDNEPATQQNHLPQVSSTTDIQSVGVSESDFEMDRHKAYEEKFVKLQEEVRQLQDEKSRWLQKEGDLEAKIKLLQDDVDSCIKKEARLGEKIKDLESGNEAIILKETILEDRIKHIEGIKDSLILHETSITEMASTLNEVNMRLEEQVKELKESRDFLVQENTQLKESIAVMESRVQHIETEAIFSRSSTMMIPEHLPVAEIQQYQSEDVPPSAENLDVNNAELVEKVKEVQIESGQHAMSDQHPIKTEHAFAAHHSNPTEFDHLNGLSHPPIPIDYSSEMSQSGESIPFSARAHNPFDVASGVEDFGSLSGVQQVRLSGFDDSRISEDIVSVPLDDIHVHEPEPHMTDDEETSLPLSDAPLLGAPFRLFSFVAKYVSGADLVHQDSARSG